MLWLADVDWTTRVARLALADHQAVALAGLVPVPGADAGFETRGQRDLTPGVLAALETDDDSKRSLIARLGDRPLAGIFREFAALRGSALHTEMVGGALVYRAFVLRARPS